MPEISMTLQISTITVASNRKYFSFGVFISLFKKLSLFYWVVCRKEKTYFVQTRKQSEILFSHTCIDFETKLPVCWAYYLGNSSPSAAAFLSLLCSS